METVKFITINTNNLAQRVDNFLISILKKVPKSHVYKIIRKGEVRVNKKRVKPTYKLQENDIVRVPPVKIFNPDNPPNPSQNLTKILENAIIFEDKNMLVLNKPAGLAVHGGSGINLGVIETLRTQQKYQRYLELVHRLDRDTSGCLVLAKTRSFLRHLQTELRQRRVEKKYLAILSGHFNKPIICDQPLLKIAAKSGERFVKIDPAGKPATTIFNPTEHLNRNLQLTEIKISTGRTHQIRVHAKFINHKVIGDSKYGDTAKNQNFKKLGLKRMFLHASFLQFKLANGEMFTISAPNSFQEFIHLLNNPTSR